MAALVKAIQVVVVELLPNPALSRCALACLTAGLACLAGGLHTRGVWCVVHHVMVASPLAGQLRAGQAAGQAAHVMRTVALLRLYTPQLLCRPRCCGCTHLSCCSCTHLSCCGCTVALLLC